MNTKNGIMTYRLGYALEKGGTYDKSLNQNDTEIDYESFLAMVSPNPLKLEFVECSVLLDDIWYATKIPLEKFAGFPQEIVY